MKFNCRVICAVAVAAVISSCSQPSQKTAIPRDEKIEQQVDNVLKGLSLEEKVGQMTQLTSSVIADADELTHAGDSILRTHKIGSVLNTLDDTAQPPQVFGEFITLLNDITKLYDETEEHVNKKQAIFCYFVITKCFYHI